MKIGNNFFGFDISAKGLSIQRKKMNLIAENLANGNSVRTEDGQPIRRKILNVTQKNVGFADQMRDISNTIQINTTNPNHIKKPIEPINNSNNNSGLEIKVAEDKSPGDVVYMPEHPNADENGYVELSNINTITEMIDMIAATRSYEANLTALNSSKQMIKDSLEI
ncbi:MAG: flagellar basal body rod protein FlgC [Ignavibacterium sp.]|nr:flagellar basal body rod protein FlgC [Ignavibacterium sp.]MCX7612539.1 flagellar basal body rod protein FlgC [Ignavibacterium sp.]MDW8374117.1 flagellar basal body rod protein FlgC [Ignavibacteriales bacterium]